MSQHGARTILTMNYMMAVVWVAAALTTETATGDTRSTFRPASFHQPAGKQAGNEIACTGLHAASALCHLKSEIANDRYDNTAFTSHSVFSAFQGGDNSRRADLLAIFRLALEEFNLLAGLRIHWDNTERYIEDIAARLKLKGEIAISDPDAAPRDRSPIGSTLSRRKISGRSSHSPGILTIFRPQKIKWNIGMDPQDLNVFFDVHVNAYMSFSGEFGDKNQVGLYFKIPF